MSSLTDTVSGAKMKVQWKCQEHPIQTNCRLPNCNWFFCLFFHFLIRGQNDSIVNQLLYLNVDPVVMCVSLPTVCVLSVCIF